MEKRTTCPFCIPFGDDIVAKNGLCYARWDRFPVSKGHLLLMPFRHTPDYFSLTDEEKQAMTDLIEECRQILTENFRPDGYNIGYNIGEAAGQTVMHCHCHLIPRYRGDTDNPRGGVRRVVAGKHYKNPMRRIQSDERVRYSSEPGTEPEEG
ncbi:MAG: HIT family protein [Methanomicrobiales archaeon]|nr:HIT family protein [Methanomicrobiales archaeon]